MADKKTTKKAVAKKAAPKKATGVKVPKKAVAKKAAKKASIKKTAIKKAVTKKAATKRTAVKKSAPKKSVIKKSTNKKSAVKKAAATRPTSKRAAAKPAATKVSSTTALLDKPIRTQAVPEVPIRRDVAPQIQNQSVSQVAKSESLATATPSVPAKPKTKQSKRDHALLVLAAILIVIAGVVAFAVPSSNQNSVADGSSQPTAEASPTPSAEATIEPEPTESQETESSAVQGFNLRYSYNSIGITLNFASAQQLGAVKEFVVQKSENGGAFSTLATVQADSTSMRIAKIDTVGKTTFRVDAVLENGSKVTSSPLTIRGLFSAE